MDALPEKLDTASQLLELTPKQLEALAYKAAVQVVSLPKEKRKGGDTGKVAIDLTIAKMADVLSNRSTNLNRIVKEQNLSTIKGTAPNLAKAVLAELDSRRKVVSRTSEQAPQEAVVSEVAQIVVQKVGSGRGEEIKPVPPPGPLHRSENTDLAALQHELDAELAAGYLPLGTRPAKAFHELEARQQFAIACQAVAELSHHGVSPASFRSMVHRRDQQSRMAEYMIGLHKGGQEYDERALANSEQYLRNADKETYGFISRCVDCAHALSRLATPEQERLIPDRVSIGSERPYRGR